MMQPLSKRTREVKIAVFIVSLIMILKIRDETDLDKILNI